MKRISHISDLHFGSTDGDVVEALVRDLNEDAPDLIVASGDLTMVAGRSEFRQARAFLERLAAPWIAVPGNHDIPPYQLLERVITPFRRYRRHIAQDTEPSFEDAEIGVVCLNTVRRWAPRREWGEGRLVRRQIAEAEARLAAMPSGLFKTVVVHHPLTQPPWSVAHPAEWADEALAAFARQGVGLVLAGHLHLPFTRLAHAMEPGRAGADVGNATGERGRLLAVQAGSATSTRLRGIPNSYSRIVIEDGCATVRARIWNGRRWADESDLVREERIKYWAAIRESASRMAGRETQRDMFATSVAKSGPSSFSMPSPSA